MDSRNIAYSIANSPLVKTALFASDPNWGRLVMAVGKADARLIFKDRYSIKRSFSYENGADRKKLYRRKRFCRDEETFNHYHCEPKSWSYEEIVWTTDLSYDYVKINSEYRT